MNAALFSFLSWRGKQCGATSKHTQGTHTSAGAYMLWKAAVVGWTVVVMCERVWAVNCDGGDRCSGHGSCAFLQSRHITTHSCMCEEGWTGSDCSKRAWQSGLREAVGVCNAAVRDVCAGTCPSALRWTGATPDTDTLHDQEAVCAGMGVCNEATGLCTCAKGYRGEACQYSA
jgi:hypothetical protein